MQIKLYSLAADFGDVVQIYAMRMSINDSNLKICSTEKKERKVRPNLKKKKKKRRACKFCLYLKIK